MSSTIKLKFLVLKIQLVIKAWHCVWWLIRIIPCGGAVPHGRITLNPHLVKASRECIDYVILHELCYIAEHNHSEVVSADEQVMPGWERQKSDWMGWRLDCWRELSDRQSFSHSPAGYPCRAVSLVLMPSTDPQRIPSHGRKGHFSVQNNR